MPKPNEVTRSWHHIDATDRVPGRLAGEIARLLRGKHKPQFSYHVDVGDFVVVTNVAKMSVPLERAQKETYIRHSGYPGGLKTSSLAREFERRPEEVLRRAVKGMMPKNRLGRRMLKKLKIYAGPDHPHEAQLTGTPSPPNQGKRKKTKKKSRKADATPAQTESPATDDLESMKATELKELAKERGIKGAGSMRKAELVAALAAAPEATEPDTDGGDEALATEADEATPTTDADEEPTATEASEEAEDEQSQAAAAEADEQDSGEEADAEAPEAEAEAEAGDADEQDTEEGA